MPKMGESITEGKIVKWHKKPGEAIKRDEILLEISTDKVDTEIPSVASGVLSGILVQEQEVAQVGAVIAYIETELEKKSHHEQGSGGASTKPGGGEVDKVLHETVEEVPEEMKGPAAGKLEAMRQVSGGHDGDRFFSPLVRSIAKAEGISEDELMTIGGSGLAGRVTKDDLRNYLETKSQTHGVLRSEPEAGNRRQEGVVQKPGMGREESIPMDNMRQLIMEHMVKSRDTSVHVAAVSEVDITVVADFLLKRGEEFEKQEGFKLTFMPFIAYACVKALKDFPLVNSSISGTKVVRHNYVNLGIAVAIETKGLLVPVIKAADEKSVLGLARAIRDLASRARTKRLTGDDTIGSTFSITNYGVFGNLIGTPIINQPNVAILGVGAVKKRPVVINDAIAIRQMGYLSLSFDHRLIDGAVGGQFLERIVQYLENFDIKQVF